MDKCRLCLKKAKLCESHIIPEFMYSSLYDEHHKFRQLTKGQIISRPKGIYEKMLCRACEDRIKINEDYVSKVFHDGTELIIKEKIGYTSILNIDYDKFKLFNLSVLWRAGVTGREEFSSVKLGQKHEEKLRKMIINENPGKPYEYPCIIVYFIDSSADIRQGLITNLHKAPRFEGHKLYKIFMAGCVWLFIVSSHTDKINSKEKLWLDNRGLIIHKKAVGEKAFLRTLLYNLE